MQPNDTILMQQVNETVVPSGTPLLNTTSILMGQKSTDQLVAQLTDQARIKRAGAFLDDPQAKVVLTGFGDDSHCQVIKEGPQLSRSPLRQLHQQVHHAHRCWRQRTGHGPQAGPQAVEFLSPLSRTPVDRREHANVPASP